jgi:NAD-dependent deacetylase
MNIEIAEKAPRNSVLLNASRPVKRRPGDSRLISNSPAVASTIPNPRRLGGRLERELDIDIPEAVIEALRAARHVVVFTGAGVSAESGVPTFRDAQTGLWERFDATELATPEAFAADPALVWGWYESRRLMVGRAQPNAAHRAIAALAERVTRLTLVTQNVDDLHERAASRDVLHLHGRLTAPRCVACRQPFVFPDAQPELSAGGERIEPPRCAACASYVRPGVVWFGEALPEQPWSAATRAARECDLFLCVGTSALVYPAASLVPLAAAAGAVTVQVNPNRTEMDGQVAFALRGPAGVILPELLQRTFWITS